MFEEYLKESYILDFKSEEIQELIKKRKWRRLEAYDCINEIYSFVRDEIIYTKLLKPNLRSSEVLKKGAGGPYTKAILLMSLLRGAGIPTRLHVYKVYKHLMFGILDKKHLRGLPEELSNYACEAYYDSRWIRLEGVILDKEYIMGLRERLNGRTGAYIGYGIGVSDVANIDIDFHGEDSLLQAKAMSSDGGVYSTPDEIVNRGICEFGLFDTYFINKNIKKIRRGRS